MLSINSLWPTDAIFRHRSMSTLAQIMVCRLTAPNHYLNQYWLIINGVLWHSPKINFQGSAHCVNFYNEFEKCICKKKNIPHFPRANELKTTNTTKRMTTESVHIWWDLRYVHTSSYRAHTNIEKLLFSNLNVLHCAYFTIRLPRRLYNLFRKHTDEAIHYTLGGATPLSARTLGWV